MGQPQRSVGQILLHGLCGAALLAGLLLVCYNLIWWIVYWFSVNGTNGPKRPGLSGVASCQWRVARRVKSTLHGGGASSAVKPVSLIQSFDGR